jgi:predicted RNA-binding Zn-ribbon protein involved in translation (DUF1610 family)
MELREIEFVLQKLQRVGIATCESCSQQAKFSEVDIFNGTYLCPDCLKKIAWRPEEILELPA